MCVCVCRGGGEGSDQHLGHIKIFCCFSLMDSCVFEEQVLFRVDIHSLTTDLTFHSPRVGLEVNI